MHSKVLLQSAFENQLRLQLVFPLLLMLMQLLMLHFLHVLLRRALDERRRQGRDAALVARV